jgi:membrane protease subunit HflC
LLKSFSFLSFSLCSLLSFASFYRSMQAYEASLGDGTTTMVLSPNSEFFKYFERGPAAR